MSSDKSNTDCYVCDNELCHPYDRPCVLCTRNKLDRKDYFNRK